MWRKVSFNEKSRIHKRSCKIKKRRWKKMRKKFRSLKLFSAILLVLSYETSEACVEDRIRNRFVLYVRQENFNEHYLYLRSPSSLPTKGFPWVLLSYWRHGHQNRQTRHMYIARELY